MRFEMIPRGICPRKIAFSLEGERVKDVEFTGGCNGNLKAISRLVDGMTVEQIESYLKGNLCGTRGTSCADQLALAVRTAYDKSLEDSGQE